MMKAPDAYRELLDCVKKLIGPDRRPKLVGFDGEGGAGKSSAASWLAWQLGMPSLHLDLFLARPVHEGPMTWRIDDLDRCIAALGDHRPLIVEGVLLLDAFMRIRARKLDYLVYVENTRLTTNSSCRPWDDDIKDTREFSLENQVARYFARANPKGRADFILSWQEP